MITSVPGTAALVAFLIGAGVNIPTANRIGALTRATEVAPDGVTPTHSERLRRMAVRLLWGARAVAILVGVATAAMGIARYLE